MKEEKIRCYSVNCAGMGRVFAGETVDELLDTIKQVCCLEEYAIGDTLEITVKEMTREQIDALPDL